MTDSELFPGTNELISFSNFIVFIYFAAELNDYLNYVVDLDYDERPDYNYVRSIFTKALKKNGFAADGKLDFSVTAASPKKKPAAKVRMCKDI